MLSPHLQREEPLVIFSYAQFDDAFESGALSGLRVALARTLQFVSGGAVAIFQPEADPQPGQQIAELTAQSLRAAVLLVAVLTPGYFRDAGCRNVLTAFLERERELGRNDLVLAIQYMPVAALADPEAAGDPLAGELAQRKIVNWQSLRGRDSSDSLVRHELERIAGRIVAVLDELRRAPAPARPALQAPSPQAADAPDAPLGPFQLTLQFVPTVDGATLRWEGVANDVSTSSFTHPYPDPQLATVLRALDAEQFFGYPGQGPQFTAAEQALLGELGLWGEGQVAQEAHRLVGQRLYAALTEDRRGELALRIARETARAAGRPLTYLLRFPPAAIELAALPWETLWDHRQALMFSRGARQLDSVERYVDLDEAIAPPLPGDRKLHILALSPRAGVPRAIRDQERAARIGAWTALRERGLLDWDELELVTPAELSRRMRNGPRPDIIHYCGHGRYRDGQGFLILDSPTGGHEQVSAERLAAVLGETRLIVIHACQSSTLNMEGGTLLTGVAPALSAVAESVVAMQFSIRTSAALHFAEVFYEQVAQGRSLQAAVAEARRSLYVVEADGVSWYVPTLYIRTRDRAPVYLVRR